MTHAGTRDSRDPVTATFRNDMLAERVALVVGGSSGIGAAIARALADAGAAVAVTGATADEVACARIHDRGDRSG